VIRLLWVWLVTGVATVVLGATVIGASLLRVRGGIYSRVTRRWARCILWASRTPVVAHGIEKVDWSKPHVLVSNHISGYDVFAIAGVMPGPFAFVAKKELERIPVFGMSWKAAGHISIDRSDRQKAIESLRRAGEQMRREGTTVIIFPEGTRSRTGELQPFKKGAFVLAMDAGVSIVPVVVRGSDEIQKPGALRIVPRTIHLYFGRPVDPAEYDAGGAEGLMSGIRAAMLAMLEKVRSVP